MDGLDRVHALGGLVVAVAAARAKRTATSTESDCARPYVGGPLPPTGSGYRRPQGQSITTRVPLRPDRCGPWDAGIEHSAQGWSAYKEEVGGSRPSAPTTQCEALCDGLGITQATGSPARMHAAHHEPASAEGDPAESTQAGRRNPLAHGPLGNSADPSAGHARNPPQGRQASPGAARVRLWAGDERVTKSIGRKFASPGTTLSGRILLTGSGRSGPAIGAGECVIWLNNMFGDGGDVHRNGARDDGLPVLRGEDSGGCQKVQTLRRVRALRVPSAHRDTSSVAFHVDTGSDRSRICPWLSRVACRDWSASAGSAPHRPGSPPVRRHRAVVVVVVADFGGFRRPNGTSRRLTRSRLRLCRYAARGNQEAGQRERDRAVFQPSRHGISRIAGFRIARPLSTRPFRRGTRTLCDEREAEPRSSGLASWTGLLTTVEAVEDVVTVGESVCPGPGRPG